ncbi:MAG: exo-beta-N-acetylmuramidase NamZ domain-containing protein [Spirochaetota bacterium]
MSARVRLGVENVGAVDPILRGRRVGLLTNAAATDSALVPTVDLVAARYDVRLLFGPEHGVRGDLAAGKAVASGVDEPTGIRVRSLYGERRAPSPEELDAIDVLAVDLPDIGSRYYTYLSTLAHAMRACAGAGVPVVVLDRPNPLGGAIVEGGVLRPEFASFVGMYPIPVRPGLTIAEYARLVNELQPACELHQAPLSGWRRAWGYRDLGLPWVMPSPNIPTPETALVYVGTCLFEGTNVSEGRGTAKPFLLFGAPWLDPRRVRATVDVRRLAGAALRETVFRPLASKHANDVCRGFELHLVAPDRFRPYAAAVAILDAIRRTHDEFVFLPPSAPGERPFIDLLAGTDELRRPGAGVDAYLERCAIEADAFLTRRAPYLLYPE